MVPRRVIYLAPSREGAGTLPAPRIEGWAVCPVSTVDQARQFFAANGFLVGLLALDGVEAPALGSVGEFLREQEATEWIALITASSLQRPEVRSVVLERCYDYHRMPVDCRRLAVTLGHAHGLASMRAEPRSPKAGYDEYQLVGHSAPMARLFRDIDKVAGVDAPILITGESGTGKELTASAVHRASRRAGKPFVAVNCGTLPATLIQSELFGHEKGAFTGAHQARTGRIAAAAGGTILLDEIGDLSPDLQVSLLRFLQEKTIDRVGGRSPVRLDVRVIAATHVDLERAVNEGRFRADLYFRLNVLRVDLPPLRTRNGDVEVLARFFFERFRGEKARRVNGFAPSALRAMDRHPWPGNVRELVNRVRRAMVMCESRLIGPSDLGFEDTEGTAHHVTLHDARAGAEREALCRTLQSNGGNISRAARQLEISRVTLYRLLEKHGVSS